MSDAQRLEELLRKIEKTVAGWHDEPWHVCQLLRDCADALTQLRAERDAYVALYGKEKEWRSEAEVALADMTAAELEAERKRHT